MEAIFRSCLTHSCHFWTQAEIDDAGAASALALISVVLVFLSFYILRCLRLGEVDTGMCSVPTSG